MGNLTEEEYKDIRKRVEERIEKQTELAVHIVAFMVANLGLHIFLNLGYTLGIIATVFSVLWGMGLAIHFTEVLFGTIISVRAREHAMQREIEMALYYKEGRVPTFATKRKNEENFSHLRIGYDGELVVANDEDKMADSDYQNNN